MNMTDVTGLQLRLARQALGFSQERAAELADLCGQTIKDWERSSNALPDAKVKALSRLVHAYEREGVTFGSSAVYLAGRPRPTMRTQISREQERPLP